MQEFNKFSVTTWVLIFCAIILQSTSFIFLKYATLANSVWCKIFFIAALIALFFRAVIWQKLISHNELSKIYPFNCINQLIILMFSTLLFNELITINNFIGVLMMMFGVYLVSK